MENLFVFERTWKFSMSACLRYVYFWLPGDERKGYFENKPRCINDPICDR